MDSDYEFDSDCDDDEINSVVSMDEIREVEEQYDLDDEFGEYEEDLEEVPEEEPEDEPEDDPDEVPEDLQGKVPRKVPGRVPGKVTGKVPRKAQRKAPPIEVPGSAEDSEDGPDLIAKSGKQI